MTDRVIWKTALQPGLHLYPLPKGAQILSAAIQHGAPMAWFLCDPLAEREERQLLFTGTGHHFPDAEYVFVATMLTEDQNFVFHVLEKRGA